MESDDGKKRESGTETIELKAIKICGGNPGAITILGNIYAAYPKKFNKVFNKLNELEFYGSDIYKLYQNSGNKNSGNKLNIFVEMVLELTENRFKAPVPNS